MLVEKLCPRDDRIFKIRGFSQLDYLQLLWDFTQENGSLVMYDYNFPREVNPDGEFGYNPNKIYEFDVQGNFKDPMDPNIPDMFDTGYYKANIFIDEEKMVLRPYYLGHPESTINLEVFTQAFERYSSFHVLTRQLTEIMDMKKQ